MFIPNINNHKSLTLLLIWENKLLKDKAEFNMFLSKRKSLIIRNKATLKESQ